MTRRLLWGLAAVLLLGAVIDATLHRDAVGQRTIGQGRAASVAAAEAQGDQDAARDRSVPTLVRSIGGVGQIVGRYSIYLQLREHAPGTTLLIDRATVRSDLSELFLRTLGAAADVRMVDTGPIELPGEPDRAGTYSGGDWTMRFALGPVAAMVVFHEGATAHLVDVRLLEQLPASVADVPAAPVTADEATSARDSAQPPALGRAIIAETAILLVLLLAGGALLPRERLHVALRVLLAPIVGVSLHATLGLLFLPGLQGLGATALAAVLLGLLAKRRGVAVGWRRSDLVALSAVGVAIAGTVAIARWQTFLFLTTDSFQYWAGGAALADGALRPGLLDLKRGLAQQSLHAPGFALGIEGLQALGAVMLMLAVLILLVVATSVETLGDRVRSRADLILPGLVVLALVVHPQVRTMAAYLNSHLPVAVLLVALVILAGLARTAGKNVAGVNTAVAAVITALVLLRPEGPMLVGLVLLGTLALARADSSPGDGAQRPWRGGWVALGVATISWSGVLGWDDLTAGAGLAPALLILGAIGVLSLVVAATIGSFPATTLPFLTILVGVGLWAVAAMLLWQDSVRFLDSVVLNLGGGSGGWGVTGPLLVILGLIVVLVSRRHTLTEERTEGWVEERTEGWVTPARWLLIGFIPLVMFAKLGDGLEAVGTELDVLIRGGGRGGWGDSVNRMWMHALLAIALLLVRAGRADGPQPAPPQSGARTARNRDRVLAGVGAALVGVAGVWVASQWDPSHVPTPADIETTRVHEVRGERAIAELVDGVAVTQSITAPLDLPPDARPTAVCVGVGLATFDREVGGRVTIDVAGDGIEATETLDARRVFDWTSEDVCLDIDRDLSFERAVARADAILAGLVIRVSGRGAEPGAAVTVLQGSSSGFGAVVTLPGPDGSVIQRRVDPMVLDVDVRYRRPPPATWAAIDRVALQLPWLMVLIGVGAVGAGVVGVVGGGAIGREAPRGGASGGGASRGGASGGGASGGKRGGPSIDTR